MMLMSQRRRCSSTASSNSSTAAAKGGGPRWVIYLSLLLLRFISINQRGYIHPDEFYQGGQELFFGQRSGASSSTISARSEYVATNVPWEYQPNHAVRSIVPPAFMTLVPIHIYTAIMHHYYSYLSDKDEYISLASTKEEIEIMNNNYSFNYSYKKQLSGKEILLIPRLFMTILSIIFLDGSLWLLVSYRNQQKQHTETVTKKVQKHKQQQQQQQTIATLSPPIEVIILASSWPCLVLSTRPFTNSLETMSVAILLAIIVGSICNTHDDTYYCSILPLILIGITCSFGIFIRFTFAFFAFPSVIIFLFHRWRRRKLISNKSSSSSNRLVGGGYRLQSLLLLLLQYVLYDGIWIMVSFLLVSYIFIYIDTQYYTSSSSSSQVNSFLNWNEEDANDNNYDNTTTCSIFSCPSSSSQSQQQQQQQGIFSKNMLNYITPMNALLYNSKQDNLALHGLHSRITHIGEYVLFLYIQVCSKHIYLHIGQCIDLCIYYSL